jgi:hypothetical protein
MILFITTAVKTSNPTLNENVGFEVLIAVAMKSSIFLDITQCSPVKVNRHFGGTYHLCLQGQGISKACSACCLLHAGFLLGLLFDTEEGSDMFLRNLG